MDASTILTNCETEELVIIGIRVTDDHLFAVLDWAEDNIAMFEKHYEKRPEIELRISPSYASLKITGWKNITHLSTTEFPDFVELNGDSIELWKSWRKESR